MKHTKHKLLSSIATLFVCLAMFIGSTYAWFTDSASTGVNKIQAGNLDLVVEHKNAKVSTYETIETATNLFRDANGNDMKWEPGAMSWETFKVSNAGSLAFKYVLQTNITGFNTVTRTDKSLKDVLKVKVLTGTDIKTNPTREAIAGLVWTGNEPTLDSFAKGDRKLYPTTDTTAGHSSSEEFQVIVYWMPTANDNDWNVNNGKTTLDQQPLFIDFGIKVLATQLEHESDSFDNTYDKNATYSESITTTVDNTKNTVFVSNATPSNEVGKTTTVEFPKETASLTNGSSMKLDIEASPVTTANSKFVVDSNGAVGAIDLKATVGSNAVTEFKDSSGTSVVVKVTTYIAKNLTNVTLNYGTESWTKANSEAEVDHTHFFYESSTGKLVFGTNHFSTFVVGAAETVYVQEENTAYLSINDALTNKNKANLKLLKNSTITERVYITNSKDINIDLRGYSIFNKSDSYIAFYLKESILTLDNGKIVDDSGKSSFLILGSSTPGEYKTKLKIGENLTITGGETDVWVNESNNISYGVTVDIHGSITGYQPVYVSGNVHNTEKPVIINVHSTANIVDTDDGSWKSDGALYLAGYAETTIENGATIKSENLNAIGIAAGKLTINGGVITGGNNIGSTGTAGGSIDSETAYAVFVKQHETNLPLSVVINNGYFEASGALKQKGQPSNNTGSLKVEINGGEFKSSYSGEAANRPKLISADAEDVLKVNGGSFTDLDSAVKYATIGKTAIKEGEWYRVVDATTEEELKQMIASGNPTIDIYGDVNLTSNLSINKDVTIIGHDASIIGYPTYIGASNTVKFVNVEFAETTAKDKASSVYGEEFKGTVIFEKCTFGNSKWESLQFTPKGDATIIITDCNFKATKNMKRFIHIQPAASNNYKLNVTITGSTFEGCDKVNYSSSDTVSVIDLDYIAKDSTLTLGDCKFYNTDGSKATNAHAYFCKPAPNYTETYDYGNMYSMLKGTINSYVVE